MVLVLVLVVVAAVAVVVTRQLTGAGGSGSARTTMLREESATRNEAATWIVAQVSPGTTVSCDRVMCAALIADGYPSGQLVVLGPTSSAPPKSRLVVVTAAVQSLYGSSLSRAWAPAILASFGSGMAGISVRLVAPHGTEAYQAQAGLDQRNRESYDSVLLNDSRINLSSAAQGQLTAGQVDPRLVVALADLAVNQPIHILQFDANGPGASPGIPLRVADLAATDQSAHMDQGPYVRALHNFLATVSAAFRPASSNILNLPDDSTIFRVIVSAPTPLGQFSLPSP